MNRRHFLTIVASSLAGSAAGVLLTFGNTGFSMHRLSVPKPVSLSPQESDELRALRLAAETPGPAVAKLEALGTLRHKPIPLPDHVRERSGLSAATHHVHYEHHYLEYLWRWESGERAFLRGVAELPRIPNGSPEYGRRRTELEGVWRAALEAGTLAVLHTMYWQQLGAAPQSRATDQVRDLARELDGGGGAADWLVLQRQGRQVEPAPWMAGTDPLFSVSIEVLGAIDLAPHAWLMDFPDRVSYLESLLSSYTDWHLDRWRTRNAVPHPAATPSGPDLEVALPSILAEAFPAGDGPDPDAVREGFRAWPTGAVRVARLPLHNTLELSVPSGLTLPNLEF